MYQSLLLLGKAAIEFTNPNEIMNDIIELPPKERKGKVIPVTGNIPTFIPILINRCIINIPTTPIGIRDPRESVAILKTRYIL